MTYWLSAAALGVLTYVLVRHVRVLWPWDDAAEPPMVEQRRKAWR